MSIAEPLDRLAPAFPWEPDWADVLERAGRSLPEHARRTALTKRRVLIAVAVLAAILVPLAALAAANDWWFLSFGGAPTPVSAPVVVMEGEWSGRPWQLVAYPSTTDGLCVALTPKGAQRGQGAAMGCGPVAGVARTPDTKASPDMTISYLAGARTRELPGYIVGPVVDTATRVEITFGDGTVLRLPTFEGPASLGRVRFYASELLPSVAPTLPTTRSSPSFVAKLAGFDGEGNVVACLVPHTAADGISPLSDCR